MKILHIFDHTLPISDGYATRSRKVLQAVQRSGFTPVAVTSPKHEQYAKGPVPKEEWIDSVRHVRSGRVSPWAFPGVNEVRVMETLKRRILDVARGSVISLIHVHSPVLNALPALRAARGLRIPLVYEIRAFWEDAAVDQGTHREKGPRYRLIRALETWVCRRADAVITICEGLRNDLVSRGIPAEKITVVPNAIDPEELRPAPADPELRARWNISPEDFVVGFIGSFYHYEGLDILLRATAMLTKGDFSDRPVKLLLVGGGEDEARLKHLAEELRLMDCVIFPGYVPHEQIPSVYAMMDVLALPRKSIRLTELVTPLKPLEAMALQTPVVASDVGGHRELIRHEKTGLLFRAGDVRGLRDAISILSKDESLRKGLVEAGRAWVVNERSWGRNASTYNRLYKEYLAESEEAKAAQTAM